jgi:hypothetical protein
MTTSLSTVDLTALRHSSLAGGVINIELLSLLGLLLARRCGALA